MKVVWLCNYSIQYLNHILKLDIDFSRLHPMPWLYYMVSEISKRREVELHVITLNSLVDKDFHIVDKGVYYHIIKERAVFIPQYTQGRISKRKLYGINILWKNKVLKLIEKINPNIINIHGTEGELQSLVTELSYPTLVWMQGLINQVIKHNMNDKYKRWLVNENILLNTQKHFVSFPGEMEEFIRAKNPGCKLYNLYHPNPQFAFDMFFEDNERNSDLIYVGALIKRKGIEDFIQMIAKLKHSIPFLKAKILGYTGNLGYLEYIKKLISGLELDDNIEMIGYVENHFDVFREIKNSKALVFPSYVDTGPRSVAESMTVGTPVIAYDIGGLPEMITSGWNGILVEPGNIDKLTNAVLEVLTDKSTAQYLAQNAYTIAREKYSPSEVINKLISLYSQIIDEGTSSKSSAA